MVVQVHRYSCQHRSPADLHRAADYRNETLAESRTTEKSPEDLFYTFKASFETF